MIKKIFSLLLLSVLVIIPIISLAQTTDEFGANGFYQQDYGPASPTSPANKSNQTPPSTTQAQNPPSTNTNNPSGKIAPGAPANITAQPNTSSNQNGTGLQNPLKFNSLEELLVGLLDLVIQIGSLLIIVMVIYTGFLFVMARGNPSKIEEARTALLWTLIGGVILLGAQGIAMFIQATVASIGG